MISSPQPQRRVIHTLASLGSIPEQHYDRQPPTQPQQQQQRRKRSRVSEDTLVSNGPGFSRVDSNETLVEQRKDMANADEVTAAAIERVRSYGIGGAGNMRMASAVKAAQDAPPAAKQEGHQRRRSSAWSSQSGSSGRRASIIDRIMRRGSKAEATENADTTTAT